MAIINEELARQAWEMNHMRDYEQGSATEEYRSYVNEAEELAEKCKATTDSLFHAKIDQLLEVYRAKIAEAINYSNKVDAMCPSILISGAGNFPTRKKAKQNARRNAVRQMFEDCEKLLDKMRGVGHAGVSSDDPDAIEKIKAKLKGREDAQQKMKDANAAARKAKQEAPYPAYALSNNNAEIRRLKKRIEELENRPHFEGWTFAGGAVEIDEEGNRVRVRHDEKPAREVIDNLKSHGFKWSPKNGAWQRQLTRDAMYAAKSLFGRAE